MSKSVFVDCFPASGPGDAHGDRPGGGRGGLPAGGPLRVRHAGAQLPSLGVI